MYRLDGMSVDVARERHADLAREAERERRMNELGIPSPSARALVGRWIADWRQTVARRRPAVRRQLRPACQD